MVLWSTRTLAFLLVTLIAVSACARNKPVVTAASEQTATNATSSTPSGVTGGSGTAADSLAREEERRRAERAAVTATILEHVLFDYDQSEISEDARRILQSKLTLLREIPDLRIRIEGHADERGSDQYNDALGQQRAAAVRRYLLGFGIAESRLEIVSYGEQRPVCQSGDPHCWAQNRRAEFQILAGPNWLR